jgi:hypothetical protein
MKKCLALLALVSVPCSVSAEPILLACQFPPMTGVPNPPPGDFSVTLDEAARTMTYITPAGVQINLPQVTVEVDAVIGTKSEARGSAGITQTEEWRINRSTGQVVRTFTLTAPKLGISEPPETFRGVCSSAR